MGYFSSCVNNIKKSPTSTIRVKTRREDYHGVNQLVGNIYNITNVEIATTAASQLPPLTCLVFGVPLVFTEGEAVVRWLLPSACEAEPPVGDGGPPFDTLLMPPSLAMSPPSDEELGAVRRPVAVAAVAAPVILPGPWLPLAV